MAQEIERGNNGTKTQPEGQMSRASSDAQAERTEGGGAPIRVDVRAALLPALQRAGNLVLNAEETDTLTAEFPKSSIRKKKLKTRTEDYIPHTDIRRRLTAALGVGQWSLVRLDAWYDEPTHTVFASYVLIVRGVWVGDTVASWEHWPNNPNSSYDDALEATSGVAIRRIAAKALCCGDQVWPHDEQGDLPSSPPVRQDAPPPPSPPQSPSVGVQEVASAKSALCEAANRGSAALAACWKALPRNIQSCLTGVKEELKREAATVDSVLDTFPEDEEMSQ